MEDNKLIKYESGQLAKVSNAIAVTNKILDLAKVEPLLIPYRKGNKWGFCSEDKTIVIDCVYESAEPFLDGKAYVIYHNSINERSYFIEELYIDKNGTIISKVFTNDYEFFCNEFGERVIECKYDEVELINNHLAFVCINENCGIINSERVEMIPCNYEEIMISKFKEGYAEIKINGKYGLIDINGKEIVPCRYRNVTIFYEGLAAVDDGFLNKEGVEVIKGYSNYYGGHYNEARFCEGLASVHNEEKLFGYIDKTGNLVIDFIYNYADSFSEGLASVSKDGKWGVINKMGDLIIPFQFESMNSLPYDGAFHYGLAAVRVDGKYGYINTKGEIVIPCIFEDADIFCNGLAIVVLNKKFGD